FVQEAAYEEVEVRPFSKIEPHNYSHIPSDKLYFYTETIVPTSRIKSLIFYGFKKSCHDRYKFDSKAEKDFATILESETSKDVLRWLRPSPSQFKIYWGHESREYRPDFVVETMDKIYMVEVKAEDETDDKEVLEKAIAGIAYCDTCNKYGEQNHSKGWNYLLIPHTAINLNRSFDLLADRYALTREMIEAKRVRVSHAADSEQPHLIDDDLWDTEMAV
ncbi:hypothetical protein KGQ71_01540, partial [Patescibacteria group bacterium]|nr:hypothetical protein [Patescibacteria group bacterium]